MPTRKLALFALVPAVLAMTACGIERRQDRREDRREDRRDRRDEISQSPDAGATLAPRYALYVGPDGRAVAARLSSMA